MHISVPVDHTIEFINATEVSPLISKCQIKVCYLGQNRNNTFITKEVAEEMGKKLPGSPIVGYYNDENGDFEQHNRVIDTSNGKFAIIDTTKAYGFVDINAKVWFQKFVDDNQEEREYLVTEGYIWTDIYPESKRIVEQGNNQSMELQKDSVKGHWSKSANSNDRFFIINEAVIEKLCILGEDFEPCFEGAQIKNHFSLETQFNELKNTVFSMINEIKETLDKGGLKTDMEEILDPIVTEEPVVEEAEVVDTPVVEEPVVEEEPAVEAETEETVAEEPVEEPIETEEEIHPEISDNSDEIPSDETENNVEEQISQNEEPDVTSQYQALLDEHQTLQQQYETLQANLDALNSEVESLRAFKLSKDREAKQAMIDSFCMLGDEDKQDVIANMDVYSLEDIEAKLAVICVRKKVNFSLESDNQEDNSVTTFNLNNSNTNNFEDTPAWVKAVKEVARNMQ